MTRNLKISGLIGGLLPSLLLGSLVISSVIGTTLAQAQNAEPILFIHGVSPDAAGTDCDTYFEVLPSALITQGVSGPQYKIGYYQNDTNCDENIMGSMGTVDIPIETLGMAFANYIYTQFTSQGTSVSIVAHSMGGLITRYAIDHNPNLNVSHVLTMGTPFNGDDGVAHLCYITDFLGALFTGGGLDGDTECNEMTHGSSFLNSLNQVQAPQGVNGTLWTNMGSNAWIGGFNSDVVVTAHSATPNGGSVVNIQYPWYDNITHVSLAGFSSYMKDIEDTGADAYRALTR